MKEFFGKHGNCISGVQSGLDRVRFRGTFRYLAVPVLMMRWLNHRRVFLKDFKPFVESLTETLKNAIERTAALSNRPVQYLSSPSISKEDLVRELIRREGRTDG